MVFGKLSNLLYKVQLTQSKIKIVHHDRLKLGHRNVQSRVETPDGNVTNWPNEVEDFFRSDVEVPNLSAKSQVIEPHCSTKTKHTECVTTGSGRQVKLPQKDSIL